MDDIAIWIAIVFPIVVAIFIAKEEHDNKDNNKKDYSN